MFVLKPLPYAFDALEPYIDAATMELHYTKHHQTYVDGLNTALSGHPELQHRSLEDLLKDLAGLPEDVRTAVRNSGGGHYNHTLFWQWMDSKGGMPRGTVYDDIKKQFGSYEAFQERFTRAAKSCFGSGWAWLSLGKQGELVIHATHNQDTPLAEGLTPLLGLDVWEHAYYLKYNNRRAEYIDAWWYVVHWDRVEDLYRMYGGG